jgi:DNA primase
MGKTYIDAVKYQIKARFEVDGLIEKPDIVGAVFGQTEGLLGDELDLRELQKSGRIGRIEVATQNRGGKTMGTVLVPSSLDMVETAILAAALETVDRVGPCEARVHVERIEDSRNTKRKQVLDRAKGLLRTLLTEEMPESKELTELVREDIKVAEVTTYGDDKLTAGPGIAHTNEVVFVEGRADVLNLLKNGIKNVVAIGGANVGKTIAQLGREKEVTVFLDGDRGGDIILRELANATDVDFVARAPPGKEVEELTRKEIIKCLRSRVPMESAMDQLSRGATGYTSVREREGRFREPAPAREPMPAREREPYGPPSREPFRESRESFAPEPAAVEAPVAPEPAPAIVQEPVDPVAAQALKAQLKELEGSLKARLLKADFTPAGEVPIRDVIRALSDTADVHAVALDGIVTQRLIDLAAQKGAKFVAGVRAGNIQHKPDGLSVVLAE